VKFLIDAQLPRELALWLREQGHDALHTLDLTDGNRTRDAEICRLADRDARVVVTKDADFVGSHQLQNTPVRLLLVATGNLSNRRLLEIWSGNLIAIQTAFDDARFVELQSGRLVVRD
jgi:predicted nuclease of predicted toxin-antitoxin system